VITPDTDFPALAGDGLSVVLVGPPAMAIPGRGAAQAAEVVLAWLHVAGDGAVTVYTGKVEVGQGIRTSLAQEVAEELRTRLASIRLVMGDTDLTPFDMGTFGSMSTPQMGTHLRKLGAATRELLLTLAADAWKAGRAGLTASDGRVRETGGERRAGYGELVVGARRTERVRGDVSLTPARQWVTAGASAPKTGAREVVTGRHRYVSDLRLPGMLFGKVLRPPSVGARLVAVETSGAGAVPGAVVARAAGFVGVAAPSLGAAEAALAAIRPTWDPGAGPEPDSRSVYDYLKQTRPSTSAPREGEFFIPEPFVQGDVGAALAAAEQRLERSYTVAYIAHVPLEPRAAVAEWTREAEGEKLTVWTGTQRPFAVRAQLAAAFGLAEAKVRVIMPDTGAGYGGKHTGEVAVEAARLARAAGRPVRVVWTREEEFRWAYFRPAGVIDVAAGVRRDGTITAWAFDNYNSGPAAIQPPYAIAHQRVTYHPSELVLRQGSYRGLAGPANFFARETHVNELAQLVGLDPVAIRLRNLDDPRLKTAVESAAERFDWGRRVAAGHGVGLACGVEKGGFVATCAEVAADRATGAVRVVRGVTAYDCGAVVNPDGLRNQIVGAFVQGIGGALFEEVEFDHGVVRNARLKDYRVPRFSDVPAIEVVLIDRKDAPPFGAGETPMMAVAPAIGAAIFDATGLRPRRLPMARNGLDGD
jgi:nicotinate dehydrogenase subunit B